MRLHGGMSVIEALPEKPVDLRPLGPSDLCYIQFSSGSTRQPHGVQITQAALMANLAGITGPAGLEVVPGDRAVSWLPLYHDMGLIGFLMAPLSTQLSLDYLTPRDFARRPTQWLNLISKNRGTIAYSPSFGYDLATRRAANQVPADLDLSCWRHAGIGGDMIRPDVLDRFAATFETTGLTAKPSSRATAWPRCASPSPSARTAPACAPTRWRPTTAGGPAASCCAARCCRAIAWKCATRPARFWATARSDGFSSPAPASCRAISASPKPRARCCQDGWLDTGDLGYTLEGEVVVTGRAKDLIIVNGRNIWPQDIEWAIETRRVVKNGDSVAFSVDGGDGEGGGERVVVAVLARVSGEEGRKTLASDVAQAVREAIAVDCDVVLVPPSIGLPTTSSGKLSRSRAKANYLAGLYAPKTAAA